VTRTVTLDRPAINGVGMPAVILGNARFPMRGAKNRKKRFRGPGVPGPGISPRDISKTAGRAQARI